MRKLSVLTAVLLAAFVLVPPWLAGAGGAPVQGHALATAFAQYWKAGQRGLTPGMQQFVDYWVRFHLVKGALSALLLLVLVLLGIRLWKAFLSGRNAGFAGAGILVTLLGFFALIALLANLQAAIVPFAKTPLLATFDSGTLAQMRHGLAGSGALWPPLAAMLSAYAESHAEMAVAGPVVALVFLGLSVGFWRRLRGADSRAKSVMATFGVVSVLLTLAFITLGVANAGNALHPRPGFLGVINGGW